MRSSADQWSVAEFNGACRSFSNKVESIAIRALRRHGYYGLNPLAQGPNSLEELKAATSNGSPLFPVYSGHSDRTIYNSPRINLLMRAWHDLVHLELDCPFSEFGEVVVCLEQMCDPMLDKCDKLLLFHDLVGQVRMHTVAGKFPEDQHGFVLDCINGGITHAIGVHGRLQ